MKTNTAAWAGGVSEVWYTGISVTKEITNQYIHQVFHQVFCYALPQQILKQIQFINLKGEYLQGRNEKKGKQATWDLPHQN